MKKITVPFFISHQGCPHTCVFCDQRIISGSGGALPGSAEISARINLWRNSANGRPVEVAFFGGTFTALSPQLQQQLLVPVQSFLDSGAVAAIRISTRPDYINAETVRWLAGMGVKTIELGVQSMDDSVLSASGRGHDSAASRAAIRCIADNGLIAGAQLMPGLPGDTAEKSLGSLESVIAAGAAFVRIYPVVVLKGTKLAEKYRAGEYQPLTVDQGVSVCKQLLHRAMQTGTDVVRIGLQADEGLNSDSVVAGCWHPAFGQLVRSEMYYDLALQLIAGCTAKFPVEIACHPSRIPDVTGHERKNLKRFIARGLTDVRIVADKQLSMDEIEIGCLNERFKGSIVTSLKYCWL